MDRCVWSNERSDAVIKITVAVPDRLGRNPTPTTMTVLPEHEDKVRAYSRAVAQDGKRMLILVLGLSVLLVLASVLPAVGWEMLTLPVTGGLAAVLGGVLFRYPFATPETFQMMGMGRSRKVVRWLAAFIVLLGLGLVATGVYAMVVGGAISMS